MPAHVLVVHLPPASGANALPVLYRFCKPLFILLRRASCRNSTDSFFICHCVSCTARAVALFSAMHGVNDLRMVGATIFRFFLLCLLLYTANLQCLASLFPYAA